MKRIDLVKLKKLYPSLRKIPKGRWFQLGLYRSLTGKDKRKRLKSVFKAQKKSKQGNIIYFFVNKANLDIEYIGITYSPELRFSAHKGSRRLWPDHILVLKVLDDTDHSQLYKEETKLIHACDPILNAYTSPRDFHKPWENRFFIKEAIKSERDSALYRLEHEEWVDAHYINRTIGEEALEVSNDINEYIHEIDHKYGKTVSGSVVDELLWTCRRIYIACGNHCESWGQLFRYISEETGISRQQLYRWYKGTSSPTLENIISVLELFEIDINLIPSNNILRHEIVRQGICWGRRM